MKTAAEIVKETSPCWGDGVNGPNTCDEFIKCELHFRLAKALTEYATAYAEARVKETTFNWMTICETEEQIARNVALEEAANIAQSHAHSFNGLQIADAICALKHSEAAPGT